MRTRSGTAAIVAALLLCGAPLALAQRGDGAKGKAAAGQGKESEKVVAIRRLMELTGAGQLGMQAMGQMVAVFRSQMPGVPQKFWDDFMREVNPDELVNLTVPIYEKHLSLQEIKDIIKFYETPAGRKLITVMPQVTAESMEVGKVWGAQLGARIQQRLREQGITTTGAGKNK
jgi:hypothetical protein